VALYGDSHLKTSWARGDHSGRQDAEWQMGMPGPNRQRYETGSPLNYADRIRAPLLLIHGEKDARVSVEESRQMAEALRRHGRAFEYVTYPDEGHGFAKPENALDVLRRIERFLDWHLL
jgi:dipeptidyl aminopeptidase/acylaminoacyl peptidase